jgi:hypothetical protein
MRLKYYLRGIGIGIILATLLLTISFYFGRDSFAKEKLTDDEIIERATELGMVMPEDEKTSDEADEAEKIDDTKSEDTTEVSEEEVPEGITGEVAEVLESEEASDVDVTNQSEDETVTYVPFSVHGGESSGTVSNNLYKAGLVDSADDFNEYITSIDLDNMIQAGSFYVKQGSTYDDIVALLVNKDVRTTTSPKKE